MNMARGFLVFVGLFLFINAKAQTSFVTLVATNGQHIVFNVPQNAVATVVHVTPPIYLGDSAPVGLAGYYSASVALDGTVVYYYPFNTNWPVVCGPAVITLDNPGEFKSGKGRLKWGTVLCTIQQTIFKRDTK